MSMKSLHKTVGIFLVVIFLLTGQYMEYRFGEWAGVDDATRMMYRSRHVYIVLAGMINIAMGLHFAWHGKLWRKRFQAAGSTIILVVPFALVAAFFYEPAVKPLERLFTGPAIVTIFAGMLLHLIAGARRGKDTSSNEQVELTRSAQASAS